MPRPRTFDAVAAIGRTLPDVEVTTAWGQPALKVRGKMFACMAAHKSAEPNSLIVMMDVVGRDACIEDAPDTYYLKPHYVNYPCVLVRLSIIRADALTDLVAGAHRFVSGKPRRPSRPSRPSTGVARPARSPLKSLRVSSSFRDFALDQLAAVPGLRSRAMFGGVGLYAGDVFFGLIAADTLYLKVDDTNRAQYERAGSKPFKPYADRPMTMPYYDVPAGVLEDAAALAAWARLSVAIAGTPKPKRRAAPGRKASRRS